MSEEQLSLVTTIVTLLSWLLREFLTDVSLRSAFYDDVIDIFRKKNDVSIKTL